jgi:hypothetical protein
MSDLQQKYWVFHEITVGVTCLKCAKYKEQATEFFEETSALNTDAAFFDLKKQILQGYVQLDGVCEHLLVQTPNARISVLFGKVLQATHSTHQHFENIICLSAMKTKQRIEWVALS